MDKLMYYDKEIIEKIAEIENWAEFEEFVKDLYANNSSTIHVERSYKNKGISGRNREVDVLVKFGFNPHVISLGVECKYWSKKVDGDIIDVALAKKEDLKLDKYAVITTIGFEAGAELYAKSKGIDLFIIRPSVDDDFGYSGRVIKFKLIMQGSRPLDINFNATVIADQKFSCIAADYLQNKLSNMMLSESEVDLDRELDLHRYSVEAAQNGTSTYTRGAYVNNLAKLILEKWSERNICFWSGEHYSRALKMRFISPTALFLETGALVLLNEINFDIQYLKSESEFEVDRGEQHPLVLENVIEKAITPLSTDCKDGVRSFTMCESKPKQDIDLSTKPEDEIGRDGLCISITLKKPISISIDDPKIKNYKLKITDNVGTWEPLLFSD